MLVHYGQQQASSSTRTGSRLALRSLPRSTAVVGWHVFLEYLVHYTPAELVVPLGGLHDDRHHSHRGLHRQLVLSLDFIYGAPLPWSEFLEYLPSSAGPCSDASQSLLDAGDTPLEQYTFFVVYILDATRLTVDFTADLMISDIIRRPPEPLAYLCIAVLLAGSLAPAVDRAPSGRRCRKQETRLGAVYILCSLHVGRHPSHRGLHRQT